MHPSLRVLHLEDDRKDADIVQDILESEGIPCEVTRVETRDDFIAALEKEAFDLILADFSLPSFDGLSALTIALERCPDVPFIFVSGALGEELAIDALKIGATDYVLKERLSRIATSVRRALREASDRAERKQAEQQLRRSEAFLAEGQRISHTGSWGWVLSSGKVIWSEEHYRMLGFEPGSVEPSVDLFVTALHADDRARVRQIIEEAINAKQPYAMSYRVVLQDGSVRHLHTVGRPVTAEAGEVDEYIGTTSDITERLAADAVLRQAQRLEAMGGLASGIAHDFNNILGAILGYGELALRDAPKGTRLRHDLDSIVAAGERGRALVERILAFSRSSVGDQVPVHVEKVVREALDLLEAKLPEGIGVEANLRAGRAASLGDPTQIHQLLMNLGTNALHAMPAGGSVRVFLEAASYDAARAATLGTIAAADYIVLSVADSGTGIPPEIIERIFDPFFTTKEVGAGTGLGLSLVHGIVTDLGGAIDVASKPGAGSKFTVYLPRAGDAAEGSETDQLEMPRGSGERVLVVDDEEPLMQLAIRVLEDLGYAPVGLTSSKAALAAFQADPQRFDAVITDERMPGLSGSALISEIRSIRRAIPILLVSGYVGADLLVRALEAGADDVLKKPLSRRELATNLARVLRGHA